jgi:predicted ester cyclase
MTTNGLNTTGTGPNDEHRLVQRFYEEAWNRWDDAVVDDLLAEKFEFRGSLGDELTGRDEWRGYRDRFRQAVPDFHNEIVELVTSPGAAAVRLRCGGHHERGVLAGCEARGQSFVYAAAAFVNCADGRLTSAWVLGDLDGLRRQLESW